MLEVRCEYDREIHSGTKIVNGRTKYNIINFVHDMRELSNWKARIIRHDL